MSQRHLHRRDLLRLGALCGLAGALSSCQIYNSPALARYVAPLPRPPRVSGSFRLVASQRAHRFHPNLPQTVVWGYNDAGFGGPVVEVRSGVTTEVQYESRLGGHLFRRDIDPTVHGTEAGDLDRPRTNVHLHGGVTAPGSDGHPDDTILPGQLRTYRFTNRQEAATLWYHDHSIGITRLNVYAGLAGVYLVRDAQDTGLPDNPLGLPSGDQEHVLLLADRRFRADGSMRVQVGDGVPEGRWQGATIADVMTVNGAAWPVAEVGRGVHRLRLVNACNAITLGLRMNTGTPWWVIGNDLGLLDAPVRTSRIAIAPGERLDVLIDLGGMAPGTRVDVLNDEPLPQQARLIGLKPITEVMRFTIGGRAAPVTRIPSRLRTTPLPAVRADGLTRRVVTINQLPDPSRKPSALMSLNNLRFHSGPLELPRQGTTEVWDLVNTTGEEHPIHLHLVGLRIVGRAPLNKDAYTLFRPRPRVGTRWAPDPGPFRTGGFTPPAAWEAGVKDTVRVPASSITRVLVEFPTAAQLGFDPDEVFARRGGTSQGYVWHCHILDHEDNDMMLKYRIVS